MLNLINGVVLCCIILYCIVFNILLVLYCKWRIFQNSESLMTEYITFLKDEL